MNRTYKKLLSQQNTIKMLVQKNEELQLKYDELESKYIILKEEGRHGYGIAKDMIEEMNEIREQYEKCIASANRSKSKYDALISELMKEHKINHKKVSELVKDVNKWR